jgi:hypothetical protein
MAYTTIDDPSVYFQTALWTGDNGNLSVTNDGNSDLKPDWIWAKRRDGTGNHVLADSTRGGDAHLRANISDAESQFGGLDFTFATDGFTSSGSTLNESSRTHVAWQWKANGGTTTTNDASSTGVGTIDSVIQANTTAGFSIITHTGSGSAGNIAHGLGAVPEWVLTKNRTDNSQSWANYHAGIGNAYYLELDTDDAKETASSVWGDTTPSSTTFRVGGANGKNNASSKNYVTYCFTPIQGYSKFGAYTGNGNADGPFVYTGFKPAWLLLKNTAADANWMLLDNKRDPFNDATPAYMDVDLSNAENTGSDAPIDFLSNGFKVRTSSSIRNPDGEIVVYMAFAEHPFVSSKGVPTTAR